MSLPWTQAPICPTTVLRTRWMAFHHRLDVADDCSGTQRFPSSPEVSRYSGKSGRWVVAKTVAAYGSDIKKSTAVGKFGATVPWMPNIGSTSLRLRTISSKALSRESRAQHHRQYPFFLSYLSLHLVLNCTLSFRASSKVLRALLLVGAGLIAWVPHFTTGIEWALRLGLHCLQQAQRHLDEPWVGIADFTMQIGSKKALIVLRVPVSALGRAKR